MTNSQLSIPVILGTSRTGRRSERVAHFVLELVKKTGVQTQLIDVRNYNHSTTVVDWMPDSTAAVQPWIDVATAADGFIIVSPEYNHFFPGELKLFLDQTLKPYQRKPAGIVGISNGQWGGTRVAEALRTYTSRLGMVAIHPAAYFPNVGELFTDDGTCTNPKQAAFTEPMIDEVLWYANALKQARISL